MNIENYPARLTTGYYRVRETWEEAASQLGAYRLLSNAMAKADENPGYHVFSDDGVAIYPEEETGVEEEGSVEEDTGKTGTVVSDGDEGSSGDDDTDEPTDEADEETKYGDDGVEEGHEQNTADEVPSNDEFPAATEYETDDNEKTIAYARLKTLMNIREGNSLEADILTTCKKDTILEVLQFCAGGWLRVRSAISGTGYAYVSNEEGQYADIGYGLYTVKRGDNLWMIAEEQLGDGTRYTELRTLNGLTSNATRVGMQLILPEK